MHDQDPKGTVLSMNHNSVLQHEAQNEAAAVAGNLYIAAIQEPRVQKQEIQLERRHRASAWPDIVR